MKRNTFQRRLKEGAIWLCAILSPLPWGGVGGGLLSSCSESEDDEGEFANWQQRNEQFFASLEDSLKAHPTVWLKYKSFTLDEGSEGKSTDYIYAKVVETGGGLDSPMYTDSVRVSYQGRLIPSATFPEGYVFDGTVYGKYSSATNASVRQNLTVNIDGYTTALLHMHRGDHWRIYIPSDLGYGDKGNDSGTIPGHSVVVFDVTLIDFSPAGEPMPAWSSRRRESAAPCRAASVTW